MTADRAVRAPAECSLAWTWGMAKKDATVVVVVVVRRMMSHDDDEDEPATLMFGCMRAGSRVRGEEETRRRSMFAREERAA